MLPWGTPYFNETGWDLDVRIIIIYYILYYKYIFQSHNLQSVWLKWGLYDWNEDNKLRAINEIPNQNCKRWVKILWLIVSKAAKIEEKKNSRMTSIK